MFKCACGKQQAPGIKPIRVPVETRDRVYTNAAGNEIGRGREIVHEVNLCPTCPILRELSGEGIEVLP